MPISSRPAISWGGGGFPQRQKYFCLLSLLLVNPTKDKVAWRFGLNSLAWHANWPCERRFDVMLNKPRITTELECVLRFYSISITRLLASIHFEHVLYTLRQFGIERFRLRSVFIAWQCEIYLIIFQVRPYNNLINEVNNTN